MFRKHPPAAACTAAVALFAATAAAALPHPAEASFDRGVLLAVAGYDADRSALPDFPVLVRIAEDSPSGFSYSQLQRPDGADLCFVDMDGAGLPFEIDTWNTNGASLAWVKLPTMTNGTRFAMCWGSETSGKDVCSDNPFAGYEGVWHMDSVDPADSSPNGCGGTHRTANLSIAPGPVGAAVNVPRTNDADGISCGSAVPNSALVGGFTIEGWCRPTQYGGLGDGAAMFGKTGFVSLRIAGSTRVTLTTPGRADHHMDLASGVLPAAGEWWHFAATFKTNTPGNGLKFYLDGRLVKTQDAGDIADKTGATEMFLGNNQWNQAFKGDLDELRLSAGIRSADWIAATYATQADPAFLAAGEAGLVDPGAPTVSAPSIVRNADGTFTVSVVVSENDAAPGSVTCFSAGSEFAMSSTNAALPKTYAATLVGLPASTTLVYSVQARSDAGATLSRTGAETFHTGDLSVAKIADGDEDGLVPGVFRISRADAGPALPVAFALGGTAVEGRSYRATDRTAAIPAGATYVDVEILPLVDPESDGPTTVELALAPGLYGIAPPGSATLSIANLTLPDDGNTWIAAVAGRASDAANWSFGHAPRADEHVLFDGRFSSADCEWDAAATHEVAAWTQDNGYTGTVTVCTVFPGKGAFTNLAVAGAMVVDAGSVTHPQSRVMGDKHNDSWDWLGDLLANETYRLSLSAGSLRVGAGGALDARGKGYWATNNGSRLTYASHGGRMGPTAPPCYGDPKEPVHVGLPHRQGSNAHNGKGGGAIRVDVAGAAVVDGLVAADGWDGCLSTEGNYVGAIGAAGSVWIEADSLSGTGRITADGPGIQEAGIPVPAGTSPDNNLKGTGGRVSIRTRLPVDRPAFARITAEGCWMGSPTASWTARYSGGSGTVVFRDAVRTNGLLVIAQQSNAAAPNLDPEFPSFWRCPSVTTNGDWTFDAIEFGHRGFLAVPVGTTLTLPGGLASCYGTEASVDALGGLRYEGGTLDIGDGDQTIAGSWMFVPWTNFVFGGSVTVSNGAAIGFHPLTDNRGADPDVLPICSAEIRGDLTVAADGHLRATDCGIVKASAAGETGFASPLLGSHSHGGRSIYLGRDPDGGLVSQAYDSVFDPRLPGCSAASISGQQCGGAIRLAVDGTLTLDGAANVSGGPAERAGSSKPAAGGAGGALSLAAGRFAGAGTIRANGGNRDDYDGPGGRIAIRLSAPGADFSAFTGRIEAGGGSWWKGGTNVLHDASAGTVYLETAAERDRRSGCVRIAMDPLDIDYILGKRDKKTLHDNTNTTEMVSLGRGGDGLRDYQHVRYVVSDYGRAAVNTNFAARSVTIADLDSFLDLEGNELVVDEFFYAADDGAGGLRMRRLGTGAHSAAAIAARGATTVYDSSAGATGRVVVRGRETILILR